MEFGVFILAQQRGYHQTSQQVITVCGLAAPIATATAPMPSSVV